MLRKLIIIGAGGQGRVVLGILRARDCPVDGFFDTNPKLTGTQIDGVPVDRAFDSKALANGIKAIIAIGDNQTRLQYVKSLSESGYDFEFVNAIHPRSFMADHIRLGKNVVIAAGALICDRVTVSDSVILNTGCIVEHGCNIEEGVHICPGAVLAGHVTVGNGAFVGLGARIIQGVTIGENAIIGAGSVVINDVEAGKTVVGVPAQEVYLRS